MKEKRLFFEVPGNHKFHSCILTTFSFDFHHFEAQVMRMVKMRGISNISVFADSRMLDQSIGISTGNIKAINSAYSLNGVFSKGAFHSKIIFCAGENQLMVLYGSGNLTNGGLGKNHELFSGLYAIDKTSAQLPLINEIWHYLVDLTNRSKGITKDKFDWVKANNYLLSDKPEIKHQYYNIDEEIDIAILYNEETTIYSQLLNLVPLTDIKKINIYCPFFDKDGRFLINLSNDFSNSLISVFLQEVGNPPTEIEENDRINFFLWDDVERAKAGFKKVQRKLHAKIFHFQSNESDYLLIGSPNATIPGFGSLNHYALNDEFAVLYKLNSRDIIDDLGLECNSPTIIIPNKLIRQANIYELEGVPSIQISVHVVGADRNGRKITVYLEKPVADISFTIKVLNHWSEILEELNFFNNGETVYQFVLNKTVSIEEITFLYLIDSNGATISNKQMINNYDLILRSCPSEENLILLRLENKIDTDDFSDLDIISFYTTIKNYEIEKNNNLKDTKISSTGDEEKVSPSVLSTISYEQALELMQNPEYHENLSTHHHSVRIWDSIYSHFNRLEEKQIEEDADDEEEGDITKGRNKLDYYSKPKKFRFSSENNLIENRKKYQKMLSNYVNALIKALTLPANPISQVDICNYLIITKTLIRTVERKSVYNVKVNIDGEYRIKEINERFFEIFGKYYELDNLTGAALQIIGKFILLLRRSKPQIKELDNYQLKKRDRYNELVYVYSMFLLTIIKQKHSYLKDYLEDKSCIKVLAFDLFLLFDDQSIDLLKEMGTLKLQCSFNDFDIDQAINYIHELKDQYNSQNYELYFHKDFGYCHIEKRIPEKSPKFYKISKPGFFCNEKDDIFILNKLVEISSGQLIQSKQQMQIESKRHEQL